MLYVRVIPSPGERRSYGWHASFGRTKVENRLSVFCRVKAVRHSSASAERRRTACFTFTSFVPYRIRSAIILALPKTSISAPKSITKANLSTQPSMAHGNSQFIWPCRRNRRPSISSAILSQAQDGHFCSDIFFEELARLGSSSRKTPAVLSRRSREGPCALATAFRTT